MTSALITVFHPGESVKENVSKVAKQVDMVFICDNSPASNQEMFSTINQAGEIRYTWFGENLGLSCAFNRILKDSQIPWQDDDYVLFFDQDSAIADGHVEKLISVYESIQKSGHDVGCLGPAYFNTSSGCVEIPKAKKTLLKDTYAVSSIITSSMLSTYGKLRSVDFWNENVFLDMADWDLCWRLVADGKLCCLTEAVILQHSVGSGEKKIGLLHLRVGSPFREYYQIRECLYLLGKKYTPLKYRIRFVSMILIRSPLHLIFLNQRRERLKYMAMGFCDYLKGRKGSLQDNSVKK